MRREFDSRYPHLLKPTEAGYTDTFVMRLIKNKNILEEVFKRSKEGWGIFFTEEEASEIQKEISKSSFGAHMAPKELADVIRDNLASNALYFLFLNASWNSQSKS